MTTYMRDVSFDLLFFFLMILRSPTSTRTYTLFPYTTLFRSEIAREQRLGCRHALGRLRGRGAGAALFRNAPPPPPCAGSSSRRRNRPRTRVAGAAPPLGRTCGRHDKPVEQRPAAGNPQPLQPWQGDGAYAHHIVLRFCARPAPHCRFGVRHAFPSHPAFGSCPAPAYWPCCRPAAFYFRRSVLCHSFRAVRTSPSAPASPLSSCVTLLFHPPLPLPLAPAPFC